METLKEAIDEHGLRLHGYCLMPNHYHLLVETPRANLSRAMGWLQTTYTIRFNRRHRRSGHLFQGRYKAHVIEADSYAMTLLRYVHLNPVRPRDKTAEIAGDRRGDLDRYPWSSHRAYAGKATPPAWLCTDWLGFFAGARTEAQRRYRRFVDDAFGAVADSPWDSLQNGLALGGEELVARVRALAGKKGHPEELRWVARLESSADLAAAIGELAEAQPERPWQVWVRVRLGGERRIDVARRYGYKDGSAITQMLKRMEAKCATTRAAQTRMSRLRTTASKPAVLS
jgi:REP element-mobilizing transposase RayT